MKKLLKFFKYIIILFVCMVLLVSCIAAGIILAKDLTDQTKEQATTTAPFALARVAEKTEGQNPPEENSSDLIGTWVFHDSVSMNNVEGMTFNISFNSNSISYTQLRIETRNTSLSIMRYDSTPVYDLDSGVGTWVNNSYKTIQITDISSLTNELLISSWLNVNATKQNVEPEPEIQGIDIYDLEFVTGIYIQNKQPSTTGVGITTFTNTRNFTVVYGSLTNHQSKYTIEIKDSTNNYVYTIEKEITYSDKSFNVFQCYLDPEVWGMEITVNLSVYNTDTEINSYSLYIIDNDQYIFDVYLKGNQDGNTLGYENGYNSGYNDGEIVGREEGHAAGYEDGYKNGYDIGVGETIGSLTGWDAVKNGITSIFEALQIKVFGLFSLGDVIMICLVFAVVMFFLKVIRG